jgi:hypothetical protein
MDVVTARRRSRPALESPLAVLCAQGEHRTWRDGAVNGAHSRRAARLAAPGMKLRYAHVMSRIGYYIHPVRLCERALLGTLATGSSPRRAELPRLSGCVAGKAAIRTDVQLLSLPLPSQICTWKYASSSTKTPFNWT